MSDFIRDDGKDLISIFMIDRLACGMSYDLIRGEFEYNFKQPLTEDLYDYYRNKYISEIELRKDELRELVYQSGTYSKLIDISNTLFKLVKEGGQPKEVSTLAATLRGYLETMSMIGRKQEVKQIKQQNNFLVLQDLETEGVLKITNPSRLKYLIDGGDLVESKSELPTE